MKDLPHWPYEGYPKFWSKEELDQLALRVIQEASTPKLRRLPGQKEEMVVRHPSLEEVRLELETRTRLQLLPLDMAIFRVAKVREGNVIAKTPEELKEASKA